MKAIRHLQGLRGPSAGSLGIGAAPVPDYDLHAGMLLQPGRQRLALSVGQQVDGAALFQIDEDRAIVMALAERPVVDTEHARGGSTRRASAMQAPQQDIR